MTPLSTIYVIALMIAAVSGGSTNSLRSRTSSTSRSSSSEEYGRLTTTPPSKPNLKVPSGIPKTFDARTHWPHCPSIGTVPNQGYCAASYAIVPTAVITDRTCIATKNSSVVYSSFDAITCCSNCPSSPANKCLGGDPVAVWEYWSSVGIVTSDCLPYSFLTSCLGQSCPQLCRGSRDTVKNRRHAGHQHYQVGHSVPDIQVEIMRNGPVEAEVDVHLEFAKYVGDTVYGSHDGIFLGKQSVKIIGWGSTSGTLPTDYWLIVNSYGSAWGNNGTGKFLRGRNHMGIETNVRAAMPIRPVKEIEFCSPILF